MNNFDLDKLEYNKILDTLSTYAQTYIGKKICNELLPSTSKNLVEKSLNETSEANALIQRKGNIPISYIENCEIYLKTIKSNLILSTKGLLELGRILKMSKELKNFFFSDDNINLSDYTILNNFFDSIYINENLEKNIFINIIDENTINDNASKKLYSIRKEYRKLEQDIKSKLNSFIHSATYSKYLQEAVVTIRNDRFVVPVKQEYRSQIKGFIHDLSSSGSTVFIEPMAIFELNNQINDLKIEENIEIEKILKQYTDMFSPIVSEIENNIRIIGRLDFIFSKAKYSLDLNGIKPILNDNKQINLIGARHPLIESNKVVPININLGIDFNSLVITGPNTGGKTVTLKIVGLLCLMAMSGLHIPAKENSSIYVFDNIFADIGDEQSIQESLSTFSSHINNIIKIINYSSSESLILLDELGSGTDPIEGSSLAISILEHFHNKNSLTIATTHYPEIKHYALLNNGFENASCEFDLENLKPTYKLLIGIPGKSNAYAISRKLGLSEKILDRASDFLSKDSINIEDLIKSIHDEKIEIDKQKDEIEKNLSQIVTLRKNLEKDNFEIENKSIKLVEDAKQEARDILLNAKDNATEIIREMKNNSNDIKKLENLRNNLNESIRNISFLDSSNLKNNEKNPSISPNDINIGDNVYIISLNQNGVITSKPNNKNMVQVQVGNIITNVSINDLQILNNIKINNQNNSYSVNAHKDNYKSKSVSPEINLIGLTTDEAIPILDKYLDDVYLSSLNHVRIVHGKGTGKLRSTIHSYLKKHSHIKSFRLGTFGEGEMGVTIVELKK